MTPAPAHTPPRWLADLVSEHRGRSDLPSLVVHPDDEMFTWSRALCATPTVGEMAYFRAGLAISDTVRNIAGQWFPDGRPHRYLDFACGYGRSLRFTCQDFGVDRVHGADVLPGAVAFIAAELGVQAYRSTTRPADFRPDGLFDYIFVSSLFSHLPRTSFGPWLRRLHDLLTPEGVLAFSTHGEPLLPAGAELDDEGYYFQPTTEVASIDKADYGATVVNEAFVARAIGEYCGSDRHARFPRALCFEQDLYVVPARADAPLAGLDVRPGPQGSVDQLWVDKDRVRVNGWAATQAEGTRVTSVDVRVDGLILGRVEPLEARPDVAEVLRSETKADCVRSGWTIAATWPGPLRTCSVVTAVATTSGGEVATFYSVPASELIAEPREEAGAGFIPERISAQAPVPLHRRAVAKLKREGLIGFLGSVRRRFLLVQGAGAALSRRRASASRQRQPRASNGSLWPEVASDHRSGRLPARRALRRLLRLTP